LSLVTSILGRFGFLGRLLRRTEIDRGFQAAAMIRVGRDGFRLGRGWFSPAKAVEFSRDEDARRARNEFLGRMPIAR